MSRQERTKVLNEIVIGKKLKVPGICYGLGLIYNDLFSIRGLLEGASDPGLYRSDLRKALTLKQVLSEEKKVFLDTSAAYGIAEATIGKLLSGIDRRRVTVCTKLSAGDMLRNGRNIKQAYQRSIDRMGIEYADIYLMHWPVTKNYLDVWRQMEELYEKNESIKAIGVCNCHIHHLQALLENCRVKPMIHQMEVHPLFTQQEEREFCVQNGIQVMAYTPLARNDDRLKNSRLLNRIARKKGKTVSQVIVRWHIQLGNIPCISTGNLKHYRENTNVYDFILSDREMEQISGLNLNSRLRYDSDHCDFWEL